MRQLKALLLSGTTGMAAEDANRVIVVNALSFLTALLGAAIETGIFFHSWDYCILVAAWAEVLTFSGIILLNYFRKYLAAGISFILIHNLAVLYFGLWKQMVKEEELLTIFLCITATLIFKPVWQTVIAWSVSICILVAAIVVNHFGLVSTEPVKAGTLYHNFGLLANAILILSAIFFSKKADTDLNKSLQDLNKILEEKNATLEKEVEKRTAELSLANKELHHANKNLRHYSRTLAHEIRTELSAQLSVGSTVFTRFKIAQNDEQDKFSFKEKEETINKLIAKIKTLYTTTLRLVALVNNTLDVARAEETGNFFDLRVTSFCLSDWSKELTDLMQHIADDKQIKITNNHAPGLPSFILSDRQMLDNAIKNLLINAVKFSKENSIVTVNIYPFMAEEKDGEKLCIEVVDEGRGIPADQIPEIFKPYVTEGKGGTGLGLPIVKSAVAHLQGSIEVKSVIDKGSSFKVTIPLIAAKQEAIPIKEDELIFLEKFSSKQEIRILIAEDQPIQRRALVSLCKALQCKPIEAGDGIECLNRFLLEKPDIVLLDVNMPRMNGYGVLTAIREQVDPKLAQTPVIVTSADLSQYLIKEFEDLAPDGYLHKPCTIREFCDCLNATIHKYALRQNIPIL